MSRIRLIVFVLPLILLACTPKSSNKGTLAQLQDMHVDIKEEENLEGGIDIAMESYQSFLKEAPDSALAPEALRRLADLKIEKEYGVLTDSSDKKGGQAPAAALPAPEHAEKPSAITPVQAETVQPDQGSVPVPGQGESDADFEKRASGSLPVAGTEAGQPAQKTDDLEKAGPLEAITLYQKLLDKYPNYERNDQVLYQMSRAYEEMGQIDKAMEVMDRLVRDFPQSRYIDEVQFRRAEYFFVRRKYLDAEDAYTAIVKIGVSSSFYELALYKLGWTFYKQELYDRALDKFIAVLDYKVSQGYDFERTEDEIERKRLEDTFRVISLSFSYLGGADAVADYFSKHGKRSYEDGIYSNLGEYYFEKRRYSDATKTYNAFIKANPFHEKSPHFLMRVIEINMAGGFPTLVIDSKKEFARKYGLKAEYWQHFKPSDYPEVLGYLKTNLTDLADHYHALYQNPNHAEDKQANFTEALHWYREFLTSFPKDKESPTINYQLADLLLENGNFAKAAVEYEKTAYDYPHHEKSSKAGYAAVYAYRQDLKNAPSQDKDRVKREVVRSSLKFADTFPEHEKAAIVLGAAVDDLYDMKDYEQAVAAAQKLIQGFPGADTDVLRSGWLVLGHSSYELSRYSEAEKAYVKVLALLPPDDKTRDSLVDNLAASIYKQGEQAKAKGDYRTAADNFLRVSKMAPTSKIRPTAEFDGAAALIQLKDWEMAATVLKGFRETFPGHKLQPEVTKKMAYVYKEEGKLSLAANEYERIEKESKDDDVRREALQVAGQLYEQGGDRDRALEVYQRYVGYFPQPVDLNLETRNKIAEILKAQGDQKNYLQQLREIVAIDASAGSARTDRTRYLAAKAGLVLAKLTYEQFVAVKLVKPLKENLQKKQELMKASTQEFGKLLDYGVGEVTAAATFYLAEVYSNFSKSLKESERPEGLSPEELEQYELALDEQSYPFEEKAIDIHENNLKLISKGVYNEWIDKSLKKLAKLVPARYDRPEEASSIVGSLETYTFAVNKPAPPVPPVSDVASVANAESAKETKAASVVKPQQVAEPGQTAESVKTAGPKQTVPQQTAESEQAAEPGQIAEPEKTAEPGPDQTAEPEKEAEQNQAVNTQHDKEPEQILESETAKPEQVAGQKQAEEGKQVELQQTAESKQAAEPKKAEKPEQNAKPNQAANTQHDKEPEQTLESETAKPEQVAGKKHAEEAKQVEPNQAAEPEQATEPNAEPEKAAGPGPDQTAEPEKEVEQNQVPKPQQTESEKVTEQKQAGEAKQVEPNQTAEPEQTAESKQAAEPKPNAKPEKTAGPGPNQAAEPEKGAEPNHVANTQHDKEPEKTLESETAKPEQATESKQAAEPKQIVEPGKTAESGLDQTAEPEKETEQNQAANTQQTESEKVTEQKQAGEEKQVEPNQAAEPEQAAESKQTPEPEQTGKSKQAEPDQAAKPEPMENQVKTSVDKPAAGGGEGVSPDAAVQ